MGSSGCTGFSESGSNSVVEYLVPNQTVAGSSPVSRSILLRLIWNVRHITLVYGSRKPHGAGGKTTDRVAAPMGDNFPGLMKPGALEVRVACPHGIPACVRKPL